MKNYFRTHHRRIATARRKAAEAEWRARQTEENWAEVRELSEWARQTRERNHLGEKLVIIMRGQA